MSNSSGRGSRAARGRGRKRDSRTSVGKENQPVHGDASGDFEGTNDGSPPQGGAVGATTTPQLRRSSRIVQATSHIDPRLVEQMRPGHVRAAREPVDGEFGSDNDSDPSAEDLQRQSGLLEGSDDEYAEASGRARTRQATQLEGSGPGESTSVNNGRSRATLTASVIQNPVFTSPHHRGNSDGLDTLCGPFMHSIPHPPQDLPPLSLINPPIIPTPYPVIRAPRSSQTHAPPTHPLPPPSAAPSQHASSLSDKRPASEALSDDEDDEAARRARRRQAANDARARYKHYKGNAKLHKVMRRACNLLQVKFATEIPYPWDDEREEAAEEMFKQACREIGVPQDFHTLTDKDIKLLRSEDTVIRSKIQREVAAQVPGIYGLVKTADSPLAVDANRQRVDALLKNSAFHYESPTTLEGRFQHPIVQDVILEAFFSHSTALACLYQDAFNPIPHPLIALVLTSIYHTLTMWKSGQKKPARFQASPTNIEKYDQYLQALNQFDEGQMQALWRRHRREVFKNGLVAAGCPMSQEPQEVVIQLAKDDEMARELARMRAKYGCGAEFEEPDLGLSPSRQSESVVLTNLPTERRPRGSRARSDEDDGVLDDYAGHDPEDGHSRVIEPHLSSLDSPSAALYGSPSAVL